MKPVLSFLLSASLLSQSLLPTWCTPAFFRTSTSLTVHTSVQAEEETASDNLGLSAPSAILMEASTGTIIYEKDADTSLHPASITKIMTLILIFDALDAGTIHLDDTVTVSEHAASMGGSQVFFEPGETQTVDTMIKCISVASANDACVAYIHSRHF